MATSSDGAAMAVPLPWRSCTDGSPPTLVDVLVVLAGDGDDHHVDMGYITPSGDWVFTGGDRMARAPVFWAPTPPLPDLTGAPGVGRPDREPSGG